jgi:hypothetical protein
MKTLTSRVLLTCMLAGLVAPGCRTFTSTLVANEFLGDRTVQYTVRPFATLAVTDSDGQGTGETETLFNLYIRMCDIEGNAQSNCVESLLLTGIDPNQDTNHIHWHDQETFYVAHNATDISGVQNVTIQVPQPYVKMCKVNPNNTVACAEQPNLNILLTPTM